MVTLALRETMWGLKSGGLGGRSCLLAQDFCDKHYRADKPNLK